MTPGPGAYEDQSVSPSVVKAIRTTEFGKYSERFETEPHTRSGSREEKKPYSSILEQNKINLRFSNKKKK